MQIETKYNLGDVVWLISYSEGALREPCQTCSGTGRVALATVDSRRVQCPECFGHREFTIGTEFKPATRKLTIGMVKAELIGSQIGPTLLGPGNNRNSGYKERNISYMCEETGVISGNVYNEEHLARSEAEALELALPLIVHVGIEREATQVREAADRARRVADLERIES